MVDLPWEVDMLRDVNFSRKVSAVFSVIIILLTACGTPSVSNTPPSINLTDVNSTAQSAAVTLFAETFAPTLTATLTPTDHPSSTPTPPPFKALEGLRATYIIDGNIYVQDSGKPAVQLTYVGQDSDPKFTDDGQKIIFFRASESKIKEIYCINSDGTDEYALITSKLLLNLGLGYDEITEANSPVIVTGTHQIIFNTQQLNYINVNNTPSTPNADLLMADIDTGKIRQLLGIGQAGNFLISPNGKLVAIQKNDHINVINIDNGQTTRINLITYSSPDAYLGLWWKEITWTGNSNELIVLPTNISGYPSIARVHTVWRYTIYGSSGIEIKLNPPPSDNAFAISPDGNWIVYSYTGGQKALINIRPDLVTWDPDTQLGIYLGNLHDGTSKLIYAVQPDETGHIDLLEEYAGWRPDSSYFMVVSGNNLYMGDIHGNFDFFRQGYTIVWIDNDHYLLPRGLIGEVGMDELFKALELPPRMFYPSDFIFLQE